jgi:NAD+ kinase
VNFALYSKTLNPENESIFKLLINKIKASGNQLSVWSEALQSLSAGDTNLSGISFFNDFDSLSNTTDLVLSIGGDGTLLSTVQLVRNSGIPVLGINTGRMGFLSAISKSEINEAIDNVLARKYTLSKRTLIQLAEPKSIFGDMNYALNEFSINKTETASMLVIHVWVDGELLQSFWADGLIISTPTGSTAYSLSCGGPIIAPSSETFVITPIAPHNLTARPVVIPDKSVIKLKFESRLEQALICLDSSTATIYDETELTISKADFHFNLMQIDGDNFFTNIRTKLNWGLDIRN